MAWILYVGLRVGRVTYTNHIKLWFLCSGLPPISFTYFYQNYFAITWTVMTCRYTSLKHACRIWFCSKWHDHTKHIYTALSTKPSNGQYLFCTYLSIYLFDRTLDHTKNNLDYIINKTNFGCISLYIDISFFSTMFLVILFSQYLRNCDLPCCKFVRGKGCTKRKAPIFKLFPVRTEFRTFLRSKIMHLYSPSM